MRGDDEHKLITICNKKHNTFLFTLKHWKLMLNYVPTKAPHIRESSSVIVGIWVWGQRKEDQTNTRALAHVTIYMQVKSRRSEEKEKLCESRRKNKVSQCIQLSEFTYSLWSSLRIRFWFSSWTWRWLLNLTFCCCCLPQLVLMTSFTEHFCKSLAVDSWMGNLARFMLPFGCSSIRMRPLCVTIQFDLGSCSQLWVLHVVDMRFGVRFGCERKALGLHEEIAGEVFLHLSATTLLLPLKSRDKHSSIAVIHFEAVRLSSHRYILNHRQHDEEEEENMKPICHRQQFVNWVNREMMMMIMMIRLTNV